MASLTLNVDEELLRQARIRALELHTTVNAVVRDYLERFVGSDHEQARAEFLFRARSSRASSGSTGRTWTRDDIYER